MAENEQPIEQKQGVINKCPNCGGALKAFASRCDLCGHELAGLSANRTVSDLVQKFAEIEAELSAAGLAGAKLEREVVARKARLIRDFPIPNAREDLQSLIYFIHPKVQDNIKPDPNQEDWRVKFKEVLNLAKNAYKGDAKTRAEFEEIERSLNVTLSGVLQTRAKRSPIIAVGVVVVAILVVVGVVSTQWEQWKLKQCEEKYANGVVDEKGRLDGIVAAVTAKQQERKYAEAQATLAGLNWNYQEACKTEDSAAEKMKWDDKRKELAGLIEKAENADKAAQEKEKRLTAEHEMTDKLADKAAEMASTRKAATKEW